MCKNERNIMWYKQRIEPLITNSLAIASSQPTYWVVCRKKKIVAKMGGGAPNPNQFGSLSLYLLKYKNVQSIPSTSYFTYQNLLCVFLIYGCYPFKLLRGLMM